MSYLRKLTRLATSLLPATAVMLLAISSAAAYTIVMRGGRRVEIPSQFVVTSRTVTYEVSPGVQITLAMNAIDITATERANHEAPGSLVARASKQSSAEPVQPRVSKRATITNRELSSFKQAREESERAYEKRRIELGLPSVEDSRRHQAEQSQIVLRELRDASADENEAENYWRARAATLRSQIAAVDAEINYARAALDRDLGQTTVGSYSIVNGATPFVSIGRSVVNPNVGAPYFVERRDPQNFFGGPRLNGRVVFGGRNARGQVSFNSGFRFARPNSPVVAIPFGTVLGSPLQSYDFGYERSLLVMRLHDLNATRAGLMARWRELEDEARRAGSPPGWLRP